ncbi:interactor of HORMAD1 protein 1 [Natator depressus]|uniref:interactor of HORMAD1 protein 1 n=1 Tax=Natator depressus TaxID=27790 RepID=UPI003EC04660
MNFNVWNIKEMFSTPTATRTNKSSSRSSAPSDYSSLSDSQFLFGSQFCPENSQSAPVPLEFSAQSRQQKSSQQNSQDSEPSIFTKYQTKPQLFGGDEKEKGSFNFGVGNLKNVLEQFEVNKKKIKDKHDSEVLSTFISSVKESIQGLQTCFDKFEERLDSRNKSILDCLEAVSKTLQETAQSHYGSVLNALTDKSQMEQILLEMERRLAAGCENLRSSPDLRDTETDQQPCGRCTTKQQASYATSSILFRFHQEGH